MRINKPLALFMGILLVPFTTSCDAVEAPTPEKESPAVTDSHHADKAVYINDLIHETSPYLLQHAHNPVEWYPWGEEALQKAKDEDKPIFLSIGYSACHWCHVMAHESFEDPDIAAVMNEHFINIKVDREERPDLDDIYMSAVVALSGSGGWPMSVWLTPDLKPFYGGTYYPPTDRYGRPGFVTVLNAMADAWKNKRDEVETGATGLVTHISKQLTGAGAPRGQVSETIFPEAVKALKATYDETNGGWGNAPKFPSSPSIAVLLRDYARSEDEATLAMATHTLDQMADGGMYDQLGGGFHRYSVDAQWLVPHFEKMLYDNGQLAQIYLEAYQLTKKPRYAKIAREILDYELRDMRDELGAFHSTEDADSEGEEGKFYLWTHSEIIALLGEEDGAIFNAYYNVKEGGNFSSHEPYHTGLNILHLTRTPAEVATELGLSVEELEAQMVPMRAKLFAVRDKRVRPALDDKVLTSWNSLLITALAQGSRILDEPRYAKAATEAGTFILEHMMEDGVLLRTHRHGKSHLPGYLDDYSYTVNAFVDLYEATFDTKWLEAADRLAGDMVSHFWDTEDKAFFFASDKHENLIVRAKPNHDGAEPAGNSMAALGLLRLAKLLDNADYYNVADEVLQSGAPFMERGPQGYMKLLCAADFIVYPPKEIAIAGKADRDDTRAMVSATFADFVPNKVVAFVDPDSKDVEALGKTMPLLAFKTMVDGKATGYVCKNFACEAPVTEVAKLKTLLQGN